MEEKNKPNTTLEFNIISCLGLKSSFNFSRKLNTYAIVSIIQDDDRNPKKQHTLIHFQKTPTDRNGDRNPRWNHSMKFDLQTIPDDKVVSFQIKVMCENSMIRDWKIGDARLPLEDLQSDGNLRISEYLVKNSDGKERGSLKISHRFSGERAKIEEDKTVQKRNYSSMKFNADSCFRPMQTIKRPILPSVSVTNVEEGKLSCHDGSCNDKILRPSEMKFLSFNRGFDPLVKNYKNYGIRGSTKWEIELDPRAGRFPGLSVRSQSECSY